MSGKSQEWLPSKGLRLILLAIGLLVSEYGLHSNPKNYDLDFVGVGLMLTSIVMSLFATKRKP